MPPSPDLIAAQLSTPQNLAMPQPVTLASAATIVPTGLVTVLTGTVQVVTITPPIEGAHILVFIPTAALPVFSVAGNVANAGLISVANVPFLAVYQPITKKYHILAKA